MRINDDYLFDYGFQPIVNQLMMHPFDVAMSTALGAAVFLTTGALIQVNFNFPTITIMVILTAVADMASLLMFRQTLQMMRPTIQRYTRNPMRDILLRLRLGSIMVTVSFVGLTLLLPTLPIILTLIGEVLWCVTLYFVCCDTPPQIPQRSHHSPAPS